jgi:hypothetical protein
LLLAGIEVLFKPHYRLPEVDVGQVHNQIDGTATAGVTTPVGEFTFGER